MRRQEYPDVLYKNTGVFIRQKKRRHRETQEGNVEMDAEKIMHFQTRGCQGALAALGS